MKELNKAPASMLTFSGTPTEIGAEIWARMCLPAVDKVSQGLPPLSLAQLYGGFTMAAWGAMAADFGAEQAANLARQMLKTFEANAHLVDGTDLQ